MTNKQENKPLYGVQYALTGSKTDKCIMNGNSWEESKVDPKLIALKGVLSHNAALKEEYKLPQSLINQIKRAIDRSIERVQAPAKREPLPDNNYTRGVAVCD